MAFDAGSILAKMRLDISQWEKSARKVNEDQKKIAGQTKKTGSAMKGMWKQIAIGVGVTNLVTMGIRGMLRQMSDTIKVGRSFEREWANVTTMLSISRAETKKMKDELRMLSPTLGDTTELAKGMYQVLSASIEPAKAIRFLGEAAKSAKAGVTDTKTAVDALTTVINAYGLEAESVTEISDIMFGTVKRGKLTYGELAQALGTVVPVAATVGIEFKEVAAAVATLTRQGVVASKATMQLRQVMMAVLKPSEEAKEVAEGLGIELGSMALKTKGLSGFLFDLKDKTKGNADIMAKLVPNVRALTAVMALAGKASEGYAFDQEFLTETMGFTDEAFRKQMESVDFWLDTFEVASDKIKVAIYEGLVSPLRESIRTAEDFDEKVTQATNDAATSVQLHVSVMMETLGKLGKAWKATDEFLFGWIDRLRGAKEEGDELAEAEIKLAEALERMGVKAKIADDEGITPLAVSTEELAEISLTAAERIAMTDRAAEKFGLIRFDSLIEELKKIEEETGDIAGETSLLEGQWKASMSGMEEDTLNFMASIIPGMAFMTASITGSTKKMGEKTKATFMDIASSVGTTLHMIGSRNKAVSIAAAIINTAVGVSKALSAYAPPMSFIMAALQAAAGAAEVATIKGQDIPSAEKGAYLPSPAIIEAGHGPAGEVVLPLDRAPSGFGGATVSLNFYAPIITVTSLSDRDMDEAAEYLLEKTKSEIERYGGKLNG